MSIGERIREVRKRCQLTQVQLAELIGTSQQALASIENGETQNTSYLLSIARSLNVDPFWLESGVEESNFRAEISLTNDELKLVSTYRQLFTSNKTLALKILKVLGE
ncbi:helix-turn-helix domain-containing protein [Alteromonas gracilis]|uniref:helix-turn-helix domain-containing protein n=1 Tax=Alteromonas gracilis TaxID=1479524 RepID=UPI003D657D26